MRYDSDTKGRGLLYKNSGFSLVELSIVLIILGLLAGGMMAGQNLIHATKLRNAVAEVDGFTKGIRAFRDQYGDLPGDLSTATQIWGVESGGCPNGESSGKETCNGNGDGFIDDNNEKLRAWQHLSNAGFIKGMYTGAFDGGNLRRGVNVPASPIGNGMYELFYQGVTLAAWYPDGLYGRMGHHIKLGALSDDYANNALLSPIDASSIDSKYDDGVPDQGDIMTREADNATSPWCLVGSSQYVLENERAACVLYFWLD